MTREEVIAVAIEESAVTLVVEPSDAGNHARANGDKRLGAALDMLTAAGWTDEEIAGERP